MRAAALLSLTSLLAIAVLTGYVRMTFRRDFTISRIIALVLLTIPIVVASNTVRVIASAMLQENLGPAAIQGVWHEILGYLVVLIGFALIVGVSRKSRCDASKTAHLPAVPSFPVDGEPAPRMRRGWIAFGILVPAAALCIWAERFRQFASEVVDLEAVARTLPGWEERICRRPPTSPKC